MGASSSHPSGRVSNAHPNRLGAKQKGQNQVETSVRIIKSNDRPVHQTKSELQHPMDYENLYSYTQLKSLLKSRENELRALKMKMKANEDTQKAYLEIAVGLEKERVIEKIFDETRCTICTEVFIEPTSLNCGHIYCKYCLNGWREQCENDTDMELSCPTCRAKIKTEERNLFMENLISTMLSESSAKMRDDREQIINTRSEKGSLKTGILKFFNGARGYGFISQDDGGSDLFVHYSGIKDYNHSVRAFFVSRQIVQYSIEENGGRPRAVNVTGPNEAPLVEKD